MNISVFIPTYNGINRLRGILCALREQTMKEFETHILIDGSTDGTINLKKEFPEYHFHTFTNSGRAGIRNKALSICTSTHLLFLDDDMLPEKSLVEAHLKFHTYNSESILIGNGFRNPAQAATDFGKYLVSCEVAWRKNKPVEYNVTSDTFSFTACNMSLPLTIFRRLGGFNTTLHDGEDFEFGMKAMDSGIHIHYNRNVVAWHNDWPVIGDYIKRNAEYLAGRKKLVALNPEYNRYLNVPPTQTEERKRIKQLLVRPLAQSALKGNIFFRILPLPMKFIAFRSAISLYTKA